MSKAREIFRSMPRWYVAVFCVIFAVYIAGWYSTVHLSLVAKEEGRTPVPPVVAEDSSEYAALSDSLLHGRGFTTGETNDPEYFRSPGYPAFIALLRYVSGGSFFAVTFFQVIFVFISALVIRATGRKYFSSLSGEIASLMFLVNPYVFTLSLTILSDIVFLFFLIGGLAFLLLGDQTKILRNSIVSALFFSAAIYVRPMGIFALPVFLVPLLAPAVSGKKKLVSAAIMLAIVCALMLPWMIRNERSSGVFAFTSLKSYNLAWYNAPLFASHEKGTDLGEERATLAVSSAVPISHWRDLKYSVALDGETSKIILSSPLKYVVFHSVMSLPFLTDSDIRASLYIWNLQSGSDPSSKIFGGCGSFCLLSKGQIGAFFSSLGTVWWRPLEEFFVAVVLLSAVWYAWKARKEKVIRVFVFIVLYLMLLAGPVSNARYRIPVDPFIALLGVSGITLVFKSLASRYPSSHFS